jgi:hypothetical protein
MDVEEQGLFVAGAEDFYRGIKKEYDSRRKIYERLQFPLAGTISSRDWEAFVAVLMRDKAKPGHGCDLTRHEVKSAKMGNSFEYQYHRNTGLEKLEGDKQVDHIFVSYGDHYDRIEVRRLKAEQLEGTLEEWRQNIIESYQTDNPRQRCRHSLSYSFVKEHGEELLVIDNESLGN